MRKVSLGMHMTLDGYVAAPDGGLGWMFPRLNAELQDASARVLRDIDTFLMGRKTYEGMAAHWPHADGEVATLMNRAEKVVFSRTMNDVFWENTRLAALGPERELETLRALSGGTIAIAGGAEFGRSALNAGLVDEVRLTVHPVVLGDGLRLFDHHVELELVDLERFATGVVTGTYRRAQGRNGHRTS
jgi:dihydrofolate reductase